MADARFPDHVQLLQSPEHWQNTLGIITCKRLREDGHRERFGEVCELLSSDDFRRFLQEEGWYLALTGGTYRDYTSWLKEKHRPVEKMLERCHRLGPSASGVTQVANLVVYGVCRAVLFFNDMEDYYADSPQNLCLRRICNHYNVSLIEDLTSIRYLLSQWSKNRQLLPKGKEASERSAEKIGEYFGNDEVLLREDLEQEAERRRDRETLAIVSHNEKKVEMLTFCLEHMQQILSYRRVLATGTTGRFLRGLFKAALESSALLATDPFNRLAGRRSTETDEAFLQRKIQPFQSGPMGGDIQIASKIIDGTCHRVIFFQDPQTAQPHAFDIRLMEKATQDPGTGALFATSEHSARLIV